MVSAGVTTLVIVLAYLLLVLGIGEALPRPVLVQLLVGQYLLKLLIALVDTPFVYAVVGILRGRGTARVAPAD